MSQSATNLIAWVGPAAGAELSWTRAAVAELAEVTEFADVAAVVATAAGACWPAVVLLGSDAAARWSVSDLTSIARHWPLTPLVSVAASIIDGRRRSGPALPAVEEVPWNELPARLAWWLADRDSGRSGTLGLPATARREDRALEAAAALEPTHRGAEPVSVAAERAIDLEGLADLIGSSGHEIVRRSCGRPPLDEPADVLVWDTDSLGPAHLAWLRMLVANRPGLRVVVIDSFPRPETAVAALRAGAAAVLCRPLAPEALAGALLGPNLRPGVGLGPPDAPG